jgi:catechol 2,3-dioxygenase-like lactoylglutathione lyase family enzyme
MTAQPAAARLEHANITVLDPDASARMLVDLFGWRVRWSGEAINGGYTVHVGTGEQYLALYTGPERGKDQRKADDSYLRRGGLNHIGVIVPDLDAARARVVALGFEPGELHDYEPGRRFYFREDNGIEIEVVAYD